MDADVTARQTTDGRSIFLLMPGVFYVIVDMATTARVEKMRLIFGFSDPDYPEFTEHVDYAAVPDSARALFEQAMGEALDFIEEASEVLG